MLLHGQNAILVMSISPQSFYQCGFLFEIFKLTEIRIGWLALVLAGTICFLVEGLYLRKKCIPFGQRTILTVPVVVDGRGSLSSHMRHLANEACHTVCLFKKSSSICMNVAI